MKNICGSQIEKYRTERNMTYEMVSDKLSTLGISLSPHEIHQIELGKRIITDIELIGFMKIFSCTSRDISNGLFP